MFPKLKHLSGEVTGDNKKCDFKKNCLMKFVNMRKRCITHATNIFLMNNVCFTKSRRGKVLPPKCEIQQEILQ